MEAWYNLNMITIRKVTKDDGERERLFLLEFPAEENGFERPGKGFNLEDPAEFARFIQDRIDQEQGVGLKEGYVPQSTFWILNNDKLVGVGKVRHYLNANLLKHGGHVGISISPASRGEGVGTEALRLLVEYAKSLGQSPILVTNDEDNLASRKMTEKCGGILDKIENGSSYYWIV